MNKTISPVTQLIVGVLLVGISNILNNPVPTAIGMVVSVVGVILVLTGIVQAVQKGKK